MIITANQLESLESAAVLISENYANDGISAFVDGRNSDQGVAGFVVSGPETAEERILDIMEHYFPVAYTEEDLTKNLFDNKNGEINYMIGFEIIPAEMCLDEGERKWFLVCAPQLEIDGVKSIRTYEDGYYDGDQLLNSLIVDIVFEDDCENVDAVFADALDRLGLDLKTPFGCSQIDLDAGYATLHYAID